MVISQVAEKRPEKVTTFISLAAFLLRNGAVPPQQKVRADCLSVLFSLNIRLVPANRPMLLSYDSCPPKI